MSDLLVGRFQPFHLGHLKIIESMTDPIIAIVKGSKTSLDKDKNPLSEQDQIDLIKTVFPTIKIVIAKSGYVPDILEAVTGIDRVFCGADRIADYTRQINTSEHNFDVTLVETERMGSATDVRAAIRENDQSTFECYMPSILWSKYDSLREKIT